MKMGRRRGRRSKRGKATSGLGVGRFLKSALFFVWVTSIKDFGDTQNGLKSGTWWGRARLQEQGGRHPWRYFWKWGCIEMRILENGHDSHDVEDMDWMARKLWRKMSKNTYIWILIWFVFHSPKEENEANKQNSRSWPWDHNCETFFVQSVSKIFSVEKI